MNYKESGVNIELADRLVADLSKHSNQIGKFAANFPLPNTSHNLVASCDGVGTKIQLAQVAKTLYERPLNSIGQDCVAMVVNDILCENATPLFFMDYFATDKLNESDFVEITTGIREACESIDVKLIGGETAEMPGVLDSNSIDVCGFSVGLKKETAWKPMGFGDMVIGLHSSGFHSNGFSLIRKHMDIEESMDDYAFKYFLDQLLRPTLIYKKEFDILEAEGFEITGAAHITGGGFDNVNRMMQKGFKVFWNYGKNAYFKHNDLFKWIQKEAELSDEEMKKTFNCGIGMVIALKQHYTKNIPLNNFTILGTIVEDN